MAEKEFIKGKNLNVKLEPYRFYFRTEREKVSSMLKKIEEETGTAILQRNGQRIFGPPPSWSGPVPERGTELYCFRIPRDCYEVSQEFELYVWAL